MNAIPAPDTIDSRLERVLYSFEGQPIPAVNIMEAIGIDFTIKRDGVGEWIVIPQTAYVEFFHLMKRVARVIQGHGFELHYNGRPFSHAWISRRLN